eukprot:353707-Chlamydomonas_euryale.AAC.4
MRCLAHMPTPAVRLHACPTRAMPLHACPTPAARSHACPHLLRDCVQRKRHVRLRQPLDVALYETSVDLLHQAKVGVLLATGKRGGRLNGGASCVGGQAAELAAQLDYPGGGGGRLRLVGAGGSSSVFCLDGWTGGRTDEWVGTFTDGCMDRRIHGWTDACMDGRTGGVRVGRTARNVATYCSTTLATFAALCEL